MPKLELFELKRIIMSTTDASACAVIKQLAPVFDKLTYTQACKIAGRKWLDYHINAGNISGVRGGKGGKTSPIYFSRHEIVSLQTAEHEFKPLLV